MTTKPVHDKAMTRPLAFMTCSALAGAVIGLMILDVTHRTFRECVRIADVIVIAGSCR